jgi:phage I-like protein
MAIMPEQKESKMQLHLKRMLALLESHKEKTRLASLTVASCLDQNSAALENLQALHAKHDGLTPPADWMAAKNSFDRSLDRCDEANEIMDNLLIEGDRLIKRAKALREQC